MNLEEKFAEVEGVRLRYLSSTPAGPDTGLPLLLIHGYIGRAEVWSGVAQALGARHPLVIPDLPIHNRSGPFPDKDHSMEHFRKVMSAFLASLPGPRWGVIGNSIGGMLAGLLTLDHPQKVERLVLVDAAALTPTFPSSTVRMYAPMIISSYFVAPSVARMRKFLARTVYCDPAAVDEAWVRSVVDQWRDRRRRMTYLAAGNAVRRHGPELAQNLEKIRCPTLLLWGREDVQFGLATAEASVKRLPHGRLVVLERCGHVPPSEKPTETARALLQFLDGPST